MNGDMNGDMNGAIEESMDASSQESAYNSAGVATSEAVAVNNHSDNSNQDDDSNMGAGSNGELSNGGHESDPGVVGQPDSSAADSGAEVSSNQPAPNIQEQNGSNSENKESADSSDKQSVRLNTQGASVDTVNEDSVGIDINVIATTVRSRENNKKSGGNSASSLVEDSNNHIAGSESGTKLSSGSANAKASDWSEANSTAAAGVVIDSTDNSNNIPNSNNLHNAIGAQLSASRSRKRGHGDPEGSGLPLKKVLPDPKSNKIAVAVDDKMEVDSTTNVDSCDSLSGNDPVGAQGVTSQNNCTNSDSAESGGNVKGDGDRDSSSDESEQEQAQHVHEIQSDSEDDVRRVSKPEEGESDDLDSDEDSSEEEEECTDGSDGEMPNDEHVSINSDTEPEAIDDDSSKDSSPRETGEVLLVDDISNHEDDKRNKKNKMKSDEDVHEVSDNDDVADGIPAEARAVIDMYPGMRHTLMDVTRKLMTNAKEMGRQGMSGMTGMTGITGMKEASENAIIVNDTKDLAGLAKSKVSDKDGGEKKEPTVVIIDTNSSVAGKSAAQLTKGTYPVLPIDSNTASLYQSIAARGTTVTPVATKSSTITVSTSTSTSTSTSSSSATPTPILPSLTDDMFVVEAPSFIVPYVYEKPSVKPFREFVDIMGKELDDKRLKEEKEKLEKEKLKPEVKKDKPEEVPAPKTGETDATEAPKIAGTEAVVEESPKKKKSDKKAKKRNDDDDASWDGTSSSESDDDVISDDDTPKTIIIKEKEDDSLDGIKDPTTTTDLISEIKNTKSDNYFDNSLGKFFINIGVNLVQEYVQADLLKQQKRKLYKENRSGSGNVKGTELAIKSLSKNLEFSRDNNAPYKFQQKKCEFCSFKSESALAMAHHMETPHMKNNIYKCNFCAFEIRSPHDILYHMEAEHNTRGRLERAPAYHQCANCPFEDNGKGKLARHLVACAKKFKPDHNLGPPVEWEPPAKIPKQMTRARHTMMSTYQAAFTKTAPTPAVNLAALYRGRGRPTAPLPTLVNSGPRPIPGAPLVRGGLVYRPNQALMLPTNFQLLPGGQTTIKANPLGTVQGGTKSLQHQPSISITPLPRAPVQAPPPLAPLPGTPGGPPSKATFVICEICDGYIKDLDQLRNHMQWIHKVKIHPKMIYNRPPLNCQKCQFRFFTDQGLERHLLGSHGLVTSSMQEAANRGKDAGRCPACGRVYQWKLLNHVARDHNMTLKPAHLSYKCTVCTATFGMYKQFENHVYSAHSVVAKRVTEKNKSASPSPAGPSKQATITDSLLKPLKINDEITIIPQPNKTSRNTDK